MVNFPQADLNEAARAVDASRIRRKRLNCGLEILTARR
jgi:hypothetical protein